MHYFSKQNCTFITFYIIAKKCLSMKRWTDLIMFLLQKRNILFAFFSAAFFRIKTVLCKGTFFYSLYTFDGLAETFFLFQQKTYRDNLIFKGPLTLAIYMGDNTSDSDTLVLALATLDGTTIYRNDPICVASPKVAKASI